MLGRTRADSPDTASLASSDGEQRSAGAARGASPAWSREIFDRNTEKLAAEGPFGTAVLVVMQPCEMRCTFCPRGNGARPAPPEPERQFVDLYHQLATARSLGVEYVEIAGDDVLRFPAAIGLFHAAGRLGFREISVQSPGQRLADSRFAAAVAQSPLTRVELPIHGATPGEHDAVTRAPGSFDGLCRAVEQCLARGRPQVDLHTVPLRGAPDRPGAIADFSKRSFGLDVRDGAVPFCTMADYGRQAGDPAQGRRRLHLLDLGMSPRDVAAAE